MDIEIPEFKSPNEEIEFWKNKYTTTKSELDELEENFNEFQESSKQLEKEQEAQVKRLEQQNKDVTKKLETLQNRNEENLRQYKSASQSITTLQDELNKLKEERVIMLEVKRKLEQENDDLLRKERILTTSVQDLIEKYDKTIEEKVIIKNELEEMHVKDDELIQRLKQENTEQKLEIEVRRNEIIKLEEQIKAKSTAGSSTENGKTDTNDVVNKPLSSNDCSTQTPVSVSAKDDEASRSPLRMVDAMLLLVKNLEKNLQVNHNQILECIHSNIY